MKKIQTCHYCKIEMTKIKNHAFESHHYNFRCSKCGYEVHASKDEI